jgi:hypothetical protein
MTIATKGGKVIVAGGKVPEKCSCCASCRCLSNALTLTADLTFSVSWYNNVYDPRDPYRPEGGSSTIRLNFGLLAAGDAPSLPCALYDASWGNWTTVIPRNYNNVTNNVVPGPFGSDWPFGGQVVLYFTRSEQVISYNGQASTVKNALLVYVRSSQSDTLKWRIRTGASASILAPVELLGTFSGNYLFGEIDTQANPCYSDLKNITIPAETTPDQFQPGINDVDISISFV